MLSFRKSLIVVSLCAAMLVSAGKSGPIRYHSRATIDDDLLTTIVNAIVNLESRFSIPPG
ncbi:MAG TPA: hypothetical protein VF381_06850 [Thermoanaerobaculia bacterium]